MMISMRLSSVTDMAHRRRWFQLQVPDTAPDKGFFKYGNAQRFAYEYGPGQWYQLGLYDSWTALGNAGRSSSFLGDGAWHALGIGFDFMYYGPDDRALYRDGSTTRFSVHLWSGPMEPLRNVRRLADPE